VINADFDGYPSCLFDSISFSIYSTNAFGTCTVCQFLVMFIVKLS